MIGVAVGILSVLGFVWLLILVHEYGHYAAGRMLGVPADSIHVRVAHNPPHVALRDGEVWLAPMDESYAEVFQRHRSGVAPAWSYIAGGSVAESAFALALIAGLTWSGADGAAVMLARATAILFAVYLIGDAAVSLTRRAVSGDWSAMYAVQPVATIGCAATMAAAKVVTLVWVGP